MSFFIRGKQSNGIKRAKFSKEKVKKKKVTKNEEITSSEDEGADEEIPDASESENENETAQEKKLRLAKIYLEEIAKEEQERLENKQIDDEIIAKRLKEDYLSQQGKLRYNVADNYAGYDSENIKVLKSRHQRNSITCLCISNDDRFLFVGSKDGCIVKYSLKDFKQLALIPFSKTGEGHGSQITSIALTTDFKFLASSDRSSDIQIWDPNTLNHIKTLKGHKGSVTGLCFKKDSHTLYSCSKDRTAKVWSLDEMAYVETLFGHQDVIASIDTLYRDRVVTSGGRDLRIWKITEETQLIFNGHVGNIDVVRMINEENFVTGGDDGQLCLWSFLRKKPLCCVDKAHGESENSEGNWITSVAAFINSDLLASGSSDGFINIWKLENNYKTFKLLFKIPIEGFITCMSFDSNGSRLVVGCSKEHQFGRWKTVKSAKNVVYIIPFKKI